jgi:hypothetical protein
LSGPNIFDLVNHAIFDFVQQPENHRLKAGTGAYSTPFRGRLFGCSETSAVVKQLETCNVEVLWFGSNPNVPESIAQISGPQGGRSDFHDFERQMNSGAFSQCLWDAQGHATPEWNPIEAPKGNWHVYRDVLEKVVSIESVTMANFIPWGAQDLDTLVARLGALGSGLLERVVKFADYWSREIVSSLRPRFIVVPFSLARSPLNVGLSLEGATGRKDRSIDLGGTPFNFSTGICAMGVRAVYVRHPSSLQLAVDAKRKLVEELSKALREEHGGSGGDWPAAKQVTMGVALAPAVPARTTAAPLPRGVYGRFARYPGELCAV